MKSLSFEQMETVVGGSSVLHWIGCGFGIIGFGLAFAGLVTATGGAGLMIAAAAYSIAPASAALACIPN